MANVDNLEKLEALIAGEPDILRGAAGSGDVKEASKALARFAASKGVTLAPEEIEGAFAARAAAASGSVEALDDDALEHVSGGGSPYCMFTKGCYCIFTK
ncbi:Nif11-like leader peptide family natural product precursor [Azospirillum sp. TSO22-1]|uniref:Nif11-like leader peptide family natural product precursor n=1 Tax=Azospirillum sp. TSO22-1 TaxID=716789 RepID=UPI000D60AD5E|nr:Nif11-like leader peptide family natural product precursor [Azospirillum sp. TSO22-1]PWC31958.1 hypothetical protein TSO221_32105 [Azospirillum sp. TSO22-1]